MTDHSHSRPLVLVLEDEVLIGINLQDELQEAGFRVAGPFTTCTDALDWLRTSTPDVAVLDAALKDGSCLKVARKLGRRAVPFLIYSGYGEDQTLLAECRHARWIEKPIPPSELVQACQQLLGTDT
jgi:DNA-binding response OmpR family regulator